MIDIDDYGLCELYEAMRESADWRKEEDVTNAVYDLIESSVREMIQESHTCLARVYEHLIKYCAIPNRQSGSWFGSIFEHQRRLKVMLSGSHKGNIKNSFTNEVIDNCYNDGLMMTIATNGALQNKEYNDRPVSWTLENMIDDEFIKNILIQNATTEEAQSITDELYNNIPRNRKKKKGH